MKICAITMVYRDHWALGQWFRHYSRHLGPESLYVVAHGPDPEIARICPGASILTIPRGDLSQFDLRRGRLLNAFQSGLDEVYDWVIRTDADELICFDPDRYSGFADILSGLQENAVFALGLNVAELPDDPPIPPGTSVFDMRRRAVFSGHYSKAWAVRRRLGLRLHGVEVRPRFTETFRFTMPRGVYLAHLKFADAEALLAGNPHRREVAETGGKGMPGAAWQDPDDRARAFFEKLADLPVRPWDEAEEAAYARFGTDPVRIAEKGIIRARNGAVDHSTTLPEWFARA